MPPSEMPETTLPSRSLTVRIGPFAATTTPEVGCVLSATVAGAMAANGRPRAIAVANERTLEAPTCNDPPVIAAATAAPPLSTSISTSKPFFAKIPASLA